MVILNIKMAEKPCFLFETTCPSDCNTVTEEVVKIYNLRLRIQRLCMQCTVSTMPAPAAKWIRLLPRPRPAGTLAVPAWWRVGVGRGAHGRTIADRLTWSAGSGLVMTGVV